jgi:hypothetical protein
MGGSARGATLAALATGAQALALALTLAAGAAWADEADPAASAPAPAPDLSAYTLFNPVPDSLLGPICTDRPTKSNGPCTVPAGHLQIESDIVSAAFQRQGGVTTDTYVVADPNLKIGLTKTLDAELAIIPVETIVTHDHGTDSTLTGFGDMVARVKWNVIGADGGDLSIALSPFVKLPTARHGLGNGAVEEGLLIPLTYNLPAGWQFGFNGEIDALKNQNDDGRHASYTAIFSMAHPLTKTVTGSAEIWTNIDGEAGQVVRQQSFDLSFAWIPAAMQRFQLDGGLNLGLNKATPGAEVYLGVSRLF